MQPDSRGISHEQLGKEVRAIYAGLTMVEAKAISLDKAKMEAAQTSRLPSKTLYGLIGVHKALLVRLLLDLGVACNLSYLVE